MNAALDPYEALGVPRDASREDIRKAFRRKAKSAHPDAGGSAAEFDRVTRAHLVLVDPVRRQRFDETGSIDDAPQNLDQQAHGFIMGMLGSVISGDEDPSRLDLVALMKDHAGKELKAADQRIATNKRAVARAEKIAARFSRKHKGGSNMVSGMLERHVQTLRQQQAAIEHQKRVFSKAIEILGDYQFSPEMTFYDFATTTFGSNSTSTF